MSQSLVTTNTDMPLAKLQQQFSQALHYEATGESCDIVADHFSSEERIQIYRNNFIISLSEVLQATYPMVEALLGCECFEQIARQHVLKNPLLEGDVTHYGEGFDKTLELFPTVIEAAPYSPEVAKFEWLMDCVNQTVAEQAFEPNWKPMAALASIAAEEHPNVCLHLHHGVTPVSSPYAVISLKQAIESNDFSQLDVEMPQYGVLVPKPNGSTWQAVLSEEEYQLLQEIRCGTKLQNVSESLLPHLNKMIELGIVAGFTVSQA